MTLPESIAALLLLPVLLACLWRARLLALAILPPLGMALVQWFGVVDTSSAHHPLRWIVPVACAGLSALAAWWYAQKRFYDVAVGYSHWKSGCSIAPNRRAALASLLVLGSCAPDLLALHPFFWAKFAEWPLVPIMIAVEATILAVLLAPERWVGKWLS